MHPFCLVKDDKSEEFFGIFFRSSNAQAPIITSHHENTTKHIISYVTTGGNLDISFFFHGSAKEIIAAYQNFIGLPQLPPFYALGWHVGTNAITKLSEMETMMERYANASIPLETFWIESDYMDNFASFTVNQTTFGGLGEFVKNMK